jgi:hypothetical protein
MRHEVSFKWPELRKFSADSKAAAGKPKDSMSSAVVLRTASSSSTIETKFLATLNSPMSPSYSRREKESIERWWILRLRKYDAGNAFVYEGFGGIFVLLAFYQLDYVR